MIHRPPGCWLLLPLVELHPDAPATEREIRSDDRQEILIAQQRDKGELPRKPGTRINSPCSDGCSNDSSLSSCPGFQSSDPALRHSGRKRRQQPQQECYYLKVPRPLQSHGWMETGSGLPRENPSQT